MIIYKLISGRVLIISLIDVTSFDNCLKNTFAGIIRNLSKVDIF